MNDVLLEIVIDKVDAQEKKMNEQETEIQQLEEKINNIPDHKELLAEVKTRLDELKTVIGKISFPEKDIQQLSASLQASMSLLRQPIRNDIRHHHHVPKVIGVAAGLFIVLAVVCAGWYNTVRKLDGFVANDTKYRHLKLDTAQETLQLYLDKVDELYKSQSDMRKVVLATEEEYRENFERLKKAERLKSEAKTLEKAARKNNKTFANGQ